MITKIRPKTSAAITARVYLVSFQGTGSTVDKVLFDSQPISLAAGETLTIPPVYVRKDLHYGLLVQDPTGAAISMDYKSVKYTEANGETRNFLRLDTATPVASGLVLDISGAGPYCFDFTHEGVS
jgi:hypothetical protein